MYHPIWYIQFSASCHIKLWWSLGVLSRNSLVMKDFFLTFVFFELYRRKARPPNLNSLSQYRRLLPAVKSSRVVTKSTPTSLDRSTASIADDGSHLTFLAYVQKSHLLLSRHDPPTESIFV